MTPFFFMGFCEEREKLMEFSERVECACVRACSLYACLCVCMFPWVFYVCLVYHVCLFVYVFMCVWYVFCLFVDVCMVAHTACVPARVV